MCGCAHARVVCGGGEGQRRNDAFSELPVGNSIYLRVRAEDLLAHHVPAFIRLCFCAHARTFTSSSPQCPQARARWLALRRSICFAVVVVPFPLSLFLFFCFQARCWFADTSGFTSAMRVGNLVLLLLRPCYVSQQLQSRSKTEVTYRRIWHK